MQKEQKRINFIDISRALAIIFIVIGHTLVHSANCNIIFKFIYSFHVVLFFVISGYTFKLKKEEKFSKFFKNKFIRIMIPYFIWAFLFLIPYMILGQNVGNSLDTTSSFDLKTQVLNTLYGNGNANALKQNSPLWFLPALFSISIIYYFIIKLINKYPKLKIGIILPLLLISYIVNYKFNIVLPWGINTALVIGIFFYLGYLLKEYKIFENNKVKKYTLLFILLLIIGIFAFYFNSAVYCIDYDYGNLTLTIISGLCLSIFTLYVSYLINKNKILEYIGRNTMGILIFHKLIILVFQTKLGPISDLLKNSNMLIEVILTIIITIISIICSLIATEIVRKICPLLIGERRKIEVQHEKTITNI